MGRLKPGETVDAAKANLQATIGVVRKEADPSHLFLHGFFAPFRFDVETGRAGRSMLRTAYERPLLALELLVGLLLLLCCANTALLVLARVSCRTRELGVRSALGASRSRLFQQVVIEVGLLAAWGLGLGIVVGWAGARSILSMFAAVGQLPPVKVAPRTIILVFTAMVSIVSALAAGLWPAWRASRVAPAEGLREGATR